MKNYDVAIIGAGTSGLSARREVARLTDSYVVIDEGELGTTCARVGCMPSKVLIQVAEDFHRRGHYDAIGITGGDSLAVDTTRVMSHVRSLRDRFVRGVRNDMESWIGDHLIRKRARFADLPHPGSGRRENTRGTHCDRNRLQLRSYRVRGSPFGST